ncbi:hypothetical protein ACEUBT_08420 [Aeromonas bivalvium]|uniref:hypothetical protein n=1 Tax=Aeromonas bivalvium TaxID=440079 RepID=UPI0038D05BC5
MARSINTNTEQVWLWMCQQESFNLLELIAQAPIKQANAYQLMRRWLAYGHLQCVCEKMRGRRVSFRGSRYQVTDPDKAPQFGSGNRLRSPRKKRCIRRKTMQQKMWNTMKIGRFFTLSDITMTSGVDDSSASTYVSFLIQAGYVRLVSQIEGFKVKGDSNRYLLRRDTGRYAPMVRAKQGGCWDQNEQQFYPFGVEEERDEDVA